MRSNNVKHKTLIILFIAGLLLLSACENKPAESSEADKPQSEAISEAVSENTSSTDDRSTAESSEIEESSEEPSEETSDETSEESSDSSLPAGARVSELYDTEYKVVELPDSGKEALADKDGNLLTEFEYDSIYRTHCNPYRVVLSKGKHKKVVDSEFKTLAEGDFDDITGVMEREYIVVKPLDSELSALYSSDCKTKCELPEFKVIYFYSLGSENAVFITAADGTNSWYLIDKDDPLAFTAYDMDAAIAKDRDRLMKLFNSFVTELKNDNRDGMKKYAAADLLESYDAFVKDPDAEDNYAGEMVFKVKTKHLSKLYGVYPSGYDGLVCVINEKEGRYACSFYMTEHFEEFNEYATFHCYFTTVSDGKGGLLIDSVARTEFNEGYGTTS